MAEEEPLQSRMSLAEHLGELRSRLLRVVIAVLVRIWPGIAPRLPRVPWLERLASLRRVLDISVLVVLVTGGIAMGWITPSEAAAVGAFGALLVCVLRRRFSIANLRNALAETLRTSGMIYLVIIGALMLVGWIATHIAHNLTSKPLQYLALVAFVVAQAVIFAPLLLIAVSLQAGIVESAVFITVFGVLGLTAVAFITRKDFSFMRGILMLIGILALVAIAGSVLFGFQLGTWFSVAMIGFAGAAVLYDTSNIVHHYSEDRYVAAALELFASIALMFWYVLRLFMSRDD